MRGFPREDRPPACDSLGANPSSQRGHQAISSRRRTRGRPLAQWSVRQLLLLVVYSAVTCSFLVPVLQARTPAHRETLLLFDAVALPMTLALVSLLLLARGSLKDRLIAGFMALSALAMLAVVDLSYAQNAPVVTEDKRSRIPLVAVNVVLIASMIYLGWRAVRPPWWFRGS